MDLKSKSESLAQKMNRLTEKFSENLDTAHEMIVTGDDVIDFVKEKTKDIKLYSDVSDLKSEVLNLNNMVDDFKYVRETLKENTENARRVLSAITLELLSEDEEQRASLIMSFAELNKSVTDNMKLYIQSYKDISQVLMNLEKIKNSTSDSDPNKPKDGTATITVSTMDLIKKLGIKHA